MLFGKSFCHNELRGEHYVTWIRLIIQEKLNSRIFNSILLLRMQCTLDVYYQTFCCLNCRNMNVMKRKKMYFPMTWLQAKKCEMAIYGKSIWLTQTKRNHNLTVFIPFSKFWSFDKSFNSSFKVRKKLHDDRYWNLIFETSPVHLYFYLDADQSSNSWVQINVVWHIDNEKSANITFQSYQAIHRSDSNHTSFSQKILFRKFWFLLPNHWCL